MSEDEVRTFVTVIKRQIHIVAPFLFKSFISDAKEISPDEDDVHYLALALKMGIPLWSNDRALREGQDEVVVYTTQDLIRLLD